MGSIPQTIPEQWAGTPTTRCEQGTLGCTGGGSMLCSACVAANRMKPTDAEKDRRLKAFMPLLHQVTELSTEAFLEAQGRVERILEIVENPRRKVVSVGE